MKQSLNAAEIARIERVDKSTVTHWIKKGYFKNPTKVGRPGEYMISFAAYEEFKKKRRP